MKIKILVLFLFVAFYSNAQKLTLKKGSIINSIPVNDSISENFSLYLPTSFEVSKKWPIIFVFDMEGRGKQALSMFRKAAEEQKYILAASNNIHDSISISKNIRITARMLSKIYAMLPIKSARSYTAGFGGGGRFATLVPTFIKEIKGVISCGSEVANIDLLSGKNRFHFVGIVGNEDFNYQPMLRNKKVLNKLKFPNELIEFDGGQIWPDSKYLSEAMEILTLASMVNGIEPKDKVFIDESYKRRLGFISEKLKSQKPLNADKGLNKMNSVYRNLKNLDSVKLSSKTIRKTKLYRRNLRSQKAYFFKENFIKEDYLYYLEEDLRNYNYNNLGWWKYQMEELNKYEKSGISYEMQMSKRLRSFVNALVADNVDMVNTESTINEEALLFLWMVNTITDPKNHSPYLKIISLSAKVEDYGTTLFYLEELLKIGYTDIDELYKLENTALVRITPEFNTVVAKYLKNARYETLEE